MKLDKETTTVEVNISRYGGSNEITIVITVPRTETAGKKRTYVTMTPEAFALSLTGRGGITGEMCERQYPTKGGDK